MSDPSASPDLQTELEEALGKIQALEAELDKEKEQVLNLQRRPYQQMTFWCGDQPMFEGDEMDPFAAERAKMTQVITNLGAQLENLKYEHLMYKEKHMASCALAEAGLRELEALRSSDVDQRVLSLRNMVEGLKEQVAENTQAAIDRDVNEDDLRLAHDWVYYYKERLSRVIAERDSLLQERGGVVVGGVTGGENQTYTYISTAEHESILAEGKDKYDKVMGELEAAVDDAKKQKNDNLALRFEMQKLLSAQKAAEEENRGGDCDRLMKEVASLRKNEGEAEASKQEALAAQAEQSRQEYVKEKDNVLAQEREKAEKDKQALIRDREKEKEEAVAAARAVVENEKIQEIEDLRQEMQEAASEAASVAAAHKTALEGKAQEIESLRQQMQKVEAEKEEIASKWEKTQTEKAQEIESLRQQIGKTQAEKEELAAEISEKLADAKSLETTTPSSADHQQQDHHHRHKESPLASLSQEVFFTPATVPTTPAASLAPTETPSSPRPLSPSISSTPIKTPTSMLLNQAPQEQQEHVHRQAPAPATAASTSEPSSPISDESMSNTYIYIYPDCKSTQSSLEIVERVRIFKASQRAHMEKTEYHARKAKEAEAKGPFAQVQRRANLTPL